MRSPSGSFRLQVSEVRLIKQALQSAVSDKVIPSADEGAVSTSSQYHLKSPLQISAKRRTDLSGLDVRIWLVKYFIHAV
jgi:hypothetical protein